MLAADLGMCLFVFGAVGTVLGVLYAIYEKIMGA